MLGIILIAVGLAFFLQMAPHALLPGEDGADYPNEGYASLPDVMLTMFTWGAFGAFDVEELTYAIAPTFMIIIFCLFMLVRAGTPQRVSLHWSCSPGRLSQG